MPVSIFTNTGVRRSSWTEASDRARACSRSNRVVRSLARAHSARYSVGVWPHHQDGGGVRELAAQFQRLGEAGHRQQSTPGGEQFPGHRQAPRP